MKKIFCLLSAFFAVCSLGACALFKPTQSSFSDSVASSLPAQNSENAWESGSFEENSNATSEPPDPAPSYLYEDFTEQEKALFLRYIGEVIPFAPTNEYAVEGYYDVDDYENGINYYTLGNTKEDFNAYRQKFTEYDFIKTYEDDFGDTCYRYEKGDIVLDMSFYFYEGTSWIEVYVYSSLSDGGADGTGDESDSNLLTNTGKGLPSGENGVYNVDFTTAAYAKNVTEQGYYLDGCPTLSSPAVLVIPVEFYDVTAASKGYSTDKIKAAFNGRTGETDYFSVHDYYYASSYGKLDLEITVLDSWFMPKQASSYYQKQTMDYYGEDFLIGDQMILHEALTQLEDTMDLTKYDSDGNGMIDSVILINTLDVDKDNVFQWAFRFWNIYSDDAGNCYEYDGVAANDYLWASYQFLHEREDERGDTVYTDTDAVNTYTYVHEFGHVLGADDYYDSAYIEHPLGGYDMMDSTSGDHNPYTKFHFGWLTSSRLVVATESVTLTLEDFSKNGDTVILANHWDEALGAYQEYYVLMYYKNTGLNGGEYGYFEDEGIVVYHVNASLYRETIDGVTYYDVYNNNTSAGDPDGYGTENNLIEFVLSTDGEYVYTVGATVSAATTDDQGNKIAYTFTVDSLTETTATVTFRKNS